MVRRILLIVVLFLVHAGALFGADQKIEVFPAAPYDRHTIYQALVFFWIGIVGLIVIIVMKLREIKRIQDMDIDKDENDAPFLD
ncbi:MAG TPA: hypothetical protein DDZ40_05600 [Deltaproteobacteria bacterium]|nr:hypothetical protein [Deltaproteobacteria bacterium]